MKLAIIFDDLVQFGGAERLLLAIHEFWPDAPVYVSGASSEWKKRCQDLGIDLRVSFLDKFPFFVRLNRIYGVLMLHVFGFLSFALTEYDVVLSVSARYAHLVVTKPTTKHICYMNSPGRMYWEPFTYFSAEKNKGLLFAAPFLAVFRAYDFFAAKHVDYFIANSKTPQRRIQKYYGRNSEIINPFVDTLSLPVLQKNGEYFLVLSRLVAWKKINIAIEACGELGIPLKVASTGPELAAYKKLAQKYTCVEVLGYVSEEEKSDLLVNCRALINTQYEDFGISVVEAQAAGKPVIAYGKGGATETVIEGKTGLFFHEQTVEALKVAIQKFETLTFDASACTNQATNFTKEIFVARLREYVNSVYLKN